MKPEHGIKITREEMNKLKRKQNGIKYYKHFIEGANVIVTDPITLEKLEGTVISYDYEKDMYDIHLSGIEGIFVSSKYVKGW